MPATELASRLQLAKEDRTRDWIGSLIEKGILVTHGKKKGTQYLLNPRLFEQAQIDITPSLKTMEPYKLEALVIEDLKYNGRSRLSEIKQRLEGISGKEVQKTVYRMADEGILNPHGAKRNRTYELVKKK